VGVNSLYGSTPTRYIVHGNSIPWTTVNVNPGGRHAGAPQGTVQVPIPLGAIPDPLGTDHQWIIWDIDNEIVWEFWGVGTFTVQNGKNGSSGLMDAAGSWSCNTMNFAKTDGSFTGAFHTLPSPFSSTAASKLTYTGGLITLADLACGQINHTISMATSSTYEHVLPAEQNDPGTPTAASIPEGTRFFFPASVSMPNGLSPFAQMVFTAMQEYGGYVIDLSTGNGIYVENSASWLNRNDTFPLSSYLGGATTSTVLSGLPWASMEAAAPAADTAIISGSW
jgi:hypothetical protein